MQTKISIFIFLLLTAASGAGSYAITHTKASRTEVRKIVVFRDSVDLETQQKILKKAHATTVNDLESVHAKAVTVSQEDVKDMYASGVVRLEDDIPVSISLPRRYRSTPKPTPSGTPTVSPTPTSSPSAETIPWGIDRIHANSDWATTTGNSIKVGIIDTGIDSSHPDLAGNIKGGINTINPGQSTNDDNGHGTHVAGIVAAMQNNVGVVGAGPKIELYAIKALDASGSGYLSDIIEGLDWAAANGINVVNMSFGASSSIPSLQDAIKRAHDAGVVEVAAAGNDYGGPVSYPAKYPEVIAVSASNNLDQIARFSSAGPEVDLAAPGDGIYSTYKNASYRTLSGTSMATPHVVGSAALLLTQVSKCDTNSDGKCSPSEVQDRLQQTAKDLGISGKDDQSGYGLVDALKAITQ